MRLGFIKYQQPQKSYWIGLCFLCLISVSSAIKADPITIGVISSSQSPSGKSEWQPMVDQLQAKLPNHQLILKPLPVTELQEAITTHKIAFLISDAIHYVQIGAQFKLNGLATLRRSLGEVETNQAGTVIFRRSENTKWSNLVNLNDAKVGLPSAAFIESFWFNKLMRDSQNDRLNQPIHKITFTSAESVVFSVLASEVDIGVVPAGLLEALDQQGHIQINQISLLNPQQVAEFPFLLSSPLYPDWTISALPEVSLSLQSEFMTALLTLPSFNIHHQLGSFSWSPLANYDDLKKVVLDKELEIASIIDKMSLAQKLSIHIAEIMFLLVAFGVGILFVIKYKTQNKHLKQLNAQLSEEKLTQAKQQTHLEKVLMESRSIQIELEQLSLTAVEGILILNNQGVIEFANPSAEAIFGFSSGALLGLDFYHRLISHQYRQVVINQFRQFNLTSQSEVTGKTLEVEALNQDGRSIWVRLSVSAFDKDQTRFISIMMTDITQDRELRQSLKTAKEKAENYLNMVNVVIFELNTQFQIKTINQWGQKLIGISEDALLNQPFANLEISEASQLEMAMQLTEFQLSNDNVISLTLSWQQQLTGDTLTLNCELHKLMSQSSEIVGYLGSAVDITEVIRTHREAQETQAYFSTVVEKNRSGIMVTNKDGVIQFANPAAATLLNRPLPSLVNSNFGIPITSPNQKIQLDIVRPNQPPGKAELSASETEWRSQPAYLLMIHDISDLYEANQQIKQLAYHDSLTDLPNRSYFDLQVSNIITRAKRNQTGFAIFFMDLNKFKTVNDTLGHHIGDELLIQTAERLKHTVRESDFLSRMGGDEFTLIVEGTMSDDKLIQLAKKIQKSFSASFVIDKHEIHTSPSIGISRYPQDATDSTLLLSLADTAMYQAKQTHANHIALYQPEMGLLTTAAFTIDSEIRHAFEQDEFEVFYQPQMNLLTNKIVGYEALLRWHFDGSIRTPNQFIPALEASELIIEVGLWVIKTVLEQLKEWKAEGRELVRISVNVSPIQLADEIFIDSVSDLLACSEVDKQYLGIEITESIFMSNLQETRQSIDRIKSLGLEVHMDDFGTGYSSLSLLKNLPFDMVKLDMSFILNIDTDEKDYSLVKAVIIALHSMGIRVIAEGVETPSQQQRLIECGCDEIQGYILAKPMPKTLLQTYKNPFDPV